MRVNNFELEDRMDFKGLRELIDDIVALRMRIYDLERENRDLVLVNSELTTKLTAVSNELFEEKAKLNKLYRDSFEDATQNGVNIAEMIHEAEESVKNVVITHEVAEVAEEKQVVIDDPAQKRKEYMRRYMKEKRQKAKE